jgi:hypothetical protein
MARVLYRIGQFWQGLAATVAPAEMRRVAEALPSRAMPLFTQMPVDAQRHSLNVLASVQAAGCVHPDLAVAALLHDCGKVAAAQGGVRLGLWLRGPLVLLDAFAPKLAARWASPDPATGWRYALYVHQEHATIGARWAAEAGCSALSCWLIAHHQTSPAMMEGRGDEPDKRHELLAVLQAADEGN